MKTAAIRTKWTSTSSVHAMRGADAPSATAASRARVGALDRRQRESDQDRQRHQHLTDDHGRLGEPQMPLAEDALPRQQQVEDQSGDNGRRGEQALRDDGHARRVDVVER
ncbi:MAG TPA: hypothetical protein PKW35_22250, partial [Nannocystaceae bacterium]|nr:hypothetical protein [Nannocystaceae bacterium]